jgi:hypothetical protein
MIVCTVFAVHRREPRRKCLFFLMMSHDNDVVPWFWFDAKCVLLAPGYSMLGWATFCKTLGAWWVVLIKHVNRNTPGPRPLKKNTTGATWDGSIAEVPPLEASCKAAREGVLPERVSYSREEVTCGSLTLVPRCRRFQQTGKVKLLRLPLASITCSLASSSPNRESSLLSPGQFIWLILLLI